MWAGGTTSRPFKALGANVVVVALSASLVGPSLPMARNTLCTFHGHKLGMQIVRDCGTRSDELASVGWSRCRQDGSEIVIL